MSNILNPVQIPDDWLEGLSWEIVSDFQERIDTPVQFTRDDLDLFRQGVAFCHYFCKRGFGNVRAGAKSVMMVPSDLDDHDPDKVPVLGFTSYGPIIHDEMYEDFPCGMPDFEGKFDELAEWATRSNNYDAYQGEIVAKVSDDENGTKNGRSDLVEPQGDYEEVRPEEFRPSCYLSHTDLTIYAEGFPSMLVAKVGQRTRRTNFSMVQSIGDKVRSHLPQSDRIVFEYPDMVSDQSQNHVRLILLGDEPPSSYEAKKTMLTHRGRDQIIGNRRFLHPEVGITS